MKKIKILFIIGISTLILNCSKEHGFIVNEENEKPLKDVLVRDLNDSSNYVLTNEKGEFEFSECGNLLITKKGFKTDTLDKYGCKPDPECFNGHGFYMERIRTKKVSKTSNYPDSGHWQSVPKK